MSNKYFSIAVIAVVCGVGMALTGCSAIDIENKFVSASSAVGSSESESAAVETTEIVSSAVESSENESMVEETESTASDTFSVPEKNFDTDSGNKMKAVSDNDYASLISGNLTKQQFIMVLSLFNTRNQSDFRSYVGGYGENSASNPYFLYVNEMSQYLEKRGSIDGMQMLGTDSSYRTMMSLSDINRTFSAFSECQWTADMFPYTEYGTAVSGDTFVFSPATTNLAYKAEITNAEYNSDEMIVDYNYAQARFSSGSLPMSYSYKSRARAILYPTGDGLYRIDRIEETAVLEDRTGMSMSEADALFNDNSVFASSSTVSANNSAETTKPAKANAGDIYKDVLAQYPADHEYAVYDIDGNGIEELIVCHSSFYQANSETDCDIYTINGEASQLLEKDAVWAMKSGINAYTTGIPADGNGLYYRHMFLNNDPGKRITLSGGSIARTSENYSGDITPLSFTGVSDTSLLNGIEGSSSGTTVSAVSKSGSTEAAAAKGLIFPDVSCRVLTDADFSGKTGDDLQIAINDICALHGRKFVLSYWKNHYESMDWYNGTIEASMFDANINSYLNNTEMTNMRVIRSYMDAHGLTSTH